MSGVATPPVRSAALLAGGVGWVLGVALQLQQAALGVPLLPQALLAMAGLLLVAAFGLRRVVRPAAAGRAVAGSMLVAAVLAGFATTEWRAGQRLAKALPAALEGQDLVVIGVVASLPRQGTPASRFVFEPETAEWLGRPVTLPPRIQLAWYSRDGSWSGGDAVAPPSAGERWQLTVRLRRPHGAMNPNGFDFELWLWEQDIAATGYVRTGGDARNRRLDAQAGASVQRWREAIRSRIQATVTDRGAAGVIAALAVGDQAAIERDDWVLFRAVGIQHLVAISGLHITMLAWLGAAVGGWAWRRVPGRIGERLLLRLPAPLAARWIGLATALAYAVLAGWAVPAQRTVCMLAVVVVLRSLGLSWPLLAVLGAAGGAVVLLDPWALLQPGFWLSFVAVAVLIAAEPGASRALHDPALPTRAALALRLRALMLAGLHTQAVATVALAPLTLLFFHQVSVVGFLANLVAIPWVTLVVTPLALAGMVLPPLWLLSAAAVQALSVVLAPLATWSGALWHAAAAPPLLLGLGLLGGAVAVLRLPWRLRACGLAMALPLLAPPVPRPEPGSFELLALDVGQGTSLVVRTARHLLVYDAGPAFSAESEAGSRIVLPALRARGERQIDRLVLSHRDSDHTGGAAALFAGLPVRAWSSSLEERHPLRAQTPAHTRCAAGQGWTWDGVRFEILHPRSGDFPSFEAVPPRANALSCVLRVSAGAASALLTGDIEAAQEAALLATTRDSATALASTVLVAPHHGSKTSSSPAFLDAVAPGLALFQAGYRSRFGHPAPEVEARYRERRITVVRSDRCGAWIWRSDAPLSSGVCQRNVARRYWHHPGALEESGSGPP